MSDVTVEAKNLRKEFGEKHTKVVAVQDVTMRVEKGEVVLIVGPSGSGKTTLLSMIGCILTPTRGEVYLGGQKVSVLKPEMRAEVRREKIGFVFQGFNLLRSLTALENVQVALDLNRIKGKAAKEWAKVILEELGLGHRLDYYPIDMSWGEKQRVSIARAVVKKPGVILADEPTGNLDSKTGHRTAEILRELSREHGTAVIVVTHDNRLENIADRVLYLEDGLIKNG